MREELVYEIKEAYKLLGVLFSDDLKTIKTQYHALAKKVHSDNNKTGDALIDAEIDKKCDEEMKMINHAFEVINSNYDEIKLHHDLFLDENKKEVISKEDANEVAKQTSDYLSEEEILQNIYFELYKKRSERGKKDFKDKFFNKRNIMKMVGVTPSLELSEKEGMQIVAALKDFDVDKFRKKIENDYGTSDLDVSDIATVFHNSVKDLNLPEKAIGSFQYIIDACLDYYYELEEECIELAKKVVSRGTYNIDEIYGTAFIFPKEKKQVYDMIDSITPYEFEGAIETSYKNGIFAYCLNMLSLGRLQIVDKEVGTDVIINYLNVFKQSKENFYAENPYGTDIELKEHLEKEFLSKEK